MNRRQFMWNSIAATAASSLAISSVPKLSAQTAEQYEATSEKYPWGNPVLDMHFHTRKTPEANFLHLDGAGETVAVLLTNAPDDVAVANETIGKYLGRYYLFTSVDVMRPDAMEVLRKTGFAGTRGFGEFSGINVAIDGPEMQRVYELAAEMQVPVVTHYQDNPYELDHPLQPAKGFTRPRFARLENMLKAHPKTTFIGHGPSFWANVSTDPGTRAYSSGPIKPGGLSDKWLSDYPNLYGGLDATSGINVLHRDPGFARDFLTRHQNKLLFGSDCSCIDGRGAGRNAGGQAAADNSLTSLVRGNCLARVGLVQLKQLTSPDMFHKITWENGTKLLKLPV